jgi:hypothetical protein
MSDDFLFETPIEVNFDEPKTDTGKSTDMRDLAAAAGSETAFDEPPPPEAPQQLIQTQSNDLFQSIPAVKSGSGSMIIPVVGAAGAGIAGGMYAGMWGAAAGVAASGAVINLARYLTSKTSDPQAASMHLVFAVVSGIVAAYTGHKAYVDRQDRNTRARPFKKNKEMPSWLKPVL